MHEFFRVMKALSDPNRVKILKMLQHKKDGMCVCEIQTALSMAQPSVSKHLKVLEAAGMVDSRKEGLWVTYYVTDGASSPYAATLLGNLRHWLEEEESVRCLIDKLPGINREEICKRQ